MLWKPESSRLFFEANQGNGSGEGGNGGQQGGNANAGANGNASAQGQQQNGNASGQQGGDGQQAAAAVKTLTQTEVDALIDERLKRAKTKWDKDAETAAAAKAEKELPQLDQLRRQVERLEKEKSDLDVKQRESNGREVVRTAAKKIGANEDTLNAVYRMVKGDIEFDNEGEPTNIDAVLADAKQIAPALFRPAVGKGDGGAGGGGKPAADSDYMRAALDRRGR